MLLALKISLLFEFKDMVIILFLSNCRTCSKFAKLDLRLEYKFLKFLKNRVALKVLIVYRSNSSIFLVRFYA